jgi:hypothetical protein
MALHRTVINLDQYIRRAPVGNIIGPMCATCNRVVDYEGIVEGYPGEENEAGQVTKMAGSETARVLVRHHGAEELRTIDFGSREWGPMELAKWMQRIRWFNPLEDDQAGKLQR